MKKLVNPSEMHEELEEFKKELKIASREEKMQARDVIQMTLNLINIELNINKTIKTENVLRENGVETVLSKEQKRCLFMR